MNAALPSIPACARRIVSHSWVVDHEPLVWWAKGTASVFSATAAQASTTSLGDESVVVPDVALDVLVGTAELSQGLARPRLERAGWVVGLEFVLDDLIEVAVGRTVDRLLGEGHVRILLLKPFD